MLSPNVINVGDSLAATYTNMVKLKSYTYCCNNISIATLSPDPDWLHTVRDRINILSNNCVPFIQNQSYIKAKIISAFIDYTTLFDGFQQISKAIATKDEWIEALNQLKDGLITSKTATYNASVEYNNYSTTIKSTQVLLKESIDSGWLELNNEEIVMVELAAKLQQLQDKLSSFEDDFSGAQLSSGKEYIQTSVVMTYDILTAGAEASIPFLGIASLAFTVGNFFYDMYKNDAEVTQILNDIAVLKGKATANAQAAAATKMLLQVCYNLELEFLGINTNIDLLTQMWDAEIDKINIVIDAIETGSNPQHNIQLQTMSAAMATWETLKGYCNKIIDAPIQGEAVSILMSNN